MLIRFLFVPVSPDIQWVYIEAVEFKYLFFRESSRTFHLKSPVLYDININK